MRASKENARHALARLGQMRAGLNRTFIEQFLHSAEKKLPSEAAYAREARRARKARSKPAA